MYMYVFSGVMMDELFFKYSKRGFVINFIEVKWNVFFVVLFGWNIRDYFCSWF